jgi:hypothetical protein
LRRRGVFLSADCAGGEFFYPQIAQIHADYGGLSCRCAAIHAAGFFSQIKADSRRLLCVSRAGGEFFYPQIAQIHAGGLFSVVPWPHACVRQFTPPVFPADFADSRGFLFFSEPGAFLGCPMKCSLLMHHQAPPQPALLSGNSVSTSAAKILAINAMWPL